MMRRFCLVLSLMAAFPALAWPQGSVGEKVRQWRASHEADIVRDFAALLAIPNVVSDRANIRRNADWIAEQYRKRGVDTRLLEVEGAPPVVYGELRAPGATRTVVFYAHYDGQPVVPSEWASPPWSPVLRDKPLGEGGREVALETLKGAVDGEWRLYALRRR